MSKNGHIGWVWEGSTPGKKVRVSLLGCRFLAITGHAIQQMTIRQIREDEVIDTIRNPDETGLRTRRGRKRVRKWKNPTTAVDIIFELKGDTVRVITAIKIKKKPKNRQRRSRR